MTRNLKALGLALVAAFAMSAVLASAASATAINFTSEASETTITGTQVGTDVFTAAGKEVKCTEANYHGTQAGTSVSTVTITPTYEGCSVAGIIGVPIDMMSCRYVFHSGTTSNNPHRLEGSVDIECDTDGDAITIHSSLFGTPKCTLTVEEQTGIPGTVTWTNGTAPNGKMDVTVDVSLNSIKYISHEKTVGGTKMSGFGACTTFGTKEDGTYVGTATIQGDALPGGAATGVTVD